MVRFSLFLVLCVLLITALFLLPLAASLVLDMGCWYHVCVFTLVGAALLVALCYAITELINVACGLVKDDA